MGLSMNLLKGLGLLSLLFSLAACGKSQQTSAAPRPAQQPVLSPQPTSAQTGGNLTATPSEQIAENKPDPECHDCQHPDTTILAMDTQRPALDPVFLEDLRITVEATSQVLEDGVAILEKNHKTPQAADAELLAYREKHQKRMKELNEKTKDLATRLKAIGYESEMPQELNKEFEERMGKILARLEVVRKDYAKTPKVLEDFGPFIPTGQ